MKTIFGNMLTGGGEDIEQVNSLIEYFITPEQMKALMYNCLRVDIPDNNDKARIVKKILGLAFKELGTGTNRIALYKNGVVVKVALDRRGLLDNFAEFKRSPELENYLAKTYETNYLINICEYIEVMYQDDFYINESAIREVLKRISEKYLFDDIGFTDKNSYNWGRRAAKLTEEERKLYGEYADEIYDVVILDYGYLYPIRDQKEKLFRCPKCSHKLKWNATFTSIGCSNSSCNFSVTPMQLRRRMDRSYEELENQIIAQFNDLKMPNLARIEQEISKIDAKGMNNP